MNKGLFLQQSLRACLGAATLGVAAAAAAAPLPVVASFSILGDVAQHIGGERVSVRSLVAPNEDAHAYQITPADVRAIRAARLVLLNGMGFEGADLQGAVRNSGVPVALATQGITPIAPPEAHDGHDAHEGHDHADHDHDHGDADPHVWQDPVRMQTWARNVAQALQKADPQGAAYYAGRLAAYERELQTLHQWAQQQFNAVPRAQRKVLTGHDAFGYLGARYGIDFIAPQGVSTEQEASAKTVAAIIAQVRRENIRAVFVENIKDPRLLEQLSREAGVRVRGELYSDALGLPGSGADTYLSLMRHNIALMAQAMQAQAGGAR